MILRVDRVTRVHVHYPERDDGYVIYGDVTGCQDVVDLALTHDYHVRIHLLHVNRLAFRWSARLGLSDRERDLFVVAALLHDVGKAHVPHAIITKPASLTDAEWIEMHKHVQFGHDIVLGAEMPAVAEVLYQHHERLDGTGYPRGLRGSQIGDLSRMLSVIDAFSAMVDDRPYRAGMREDVAIDALERNAGTQFDPEYVKSFIALRQERMLTAPRPEDEL
jgi:HD-GYP domain-containing protein (c-di-GMP phosphodiesterase class II)